MSTPRSRWDARSRRDLHNYVYVIGEVGRGTRRRGSAHRASTAQRRRFGRMSCRGTPRRGRALFQWSAALSAGARPDRATDAAPDGEALRACTRASIGTVAALPPPSLNAPTCALSSPASSQPSVCRRSNASGWVFSPICAGYVPWEAGGDRGAVAAVELSYLKGFKTGFVRELMPSCSRMPAPSV